MRAALDQDARKPALAQRRQDRGRRDLAVVALRFRRSRRRAASCGRTPSAVITRRRIPSSSSTLAAGGRRPRGSSMMRAGLGPAQRRTVSKGSSATAVPMPISTASTSARSRCRCARPAGPLMYLECPVTVAIRPSIDCPICPTTTRSSIVPWRSGPNRSSQGCREGAVQGAEIAWNFLPRSRRYRSRYQARLRRPCLRARLRKQKDDANVQTNDLR